MAFVRFVSWARVPDLGHRLGIFHALSRLRDSGELSAAEQATALELSGWFGTHLARPTRFTRKRNAGHRRPRALSWFKDSAQRHLRRIREVAALLEAHDCRVEMLCSKRPGYIVYEDAYQVAAEPFADTPGCSTHSSNS